MMARRLDGEFRIAKQANDSQDSSFWNLLTLDHYSLDKELDDAAVRAFERLHYGQHGRPRPQVDVEETNSKTTVDKIAEVKGSRSDDPDSSPEREQNVSQRNNNDDNKAAGLKKHKQRERTSLNGKKSVMITNKVNRANLDHVQTLPSPSASLEKRSGSLHRRLDIKVCQQSEVDKAVASNKEQDTVDIPDIGAMEGGDRKDIDAAVNNSTPEEHTTESRGDRKEEDQVVTMSTLPKEAKLEFVWIKTIPTTENCVRLKVDGIKDLITLRYVSDRDAYLSPEVSVPCDNYKCCLLVNGKQYNTEPIEVKHYTFEVDLYIEETDKDITPAVQTSSLKVAPQQQSLGSKVRSSQSNVARESRSRSEGAPGKSSEIINANSQRQLVSKQSASRSAKLTPVTDDMEDVMEGEDGEIRRSNRLERLLRQQMAGKVAAIDDVAMEDVYLDQVGSSHRQFLDNFRPVSGQNSTVSSKHSIGSSEQELNKYLVPVDDHHHRDYNNHTTMSSNGPIARSRSVDALNKENGSLYSITYRSPDGTPTSSGRPGHGGVKSGECDKNTGYGMDFPASGMLTSTPSGDYQQLHDQDHHGDGYASSVQSLLSLPTSRTGSEELRRETGYLEQSQESLYSGGSHQPAIRTPLVTTRTTLAMTRPSVTDREDAQRMKELDETVASLQRKLTDRDRDLEILTRERCHLSEELHRLRQIYETPTEGRDQNEKRINQLIQEKENLATEVWKLKRQLEEIKQDLLQAKAASTEKSSKLDQNGYRDDHLHSYDPNNRNALQRKIGDLQSQMQDVNEAHESTVNKLSSSEHKLVKLKENHHSLMMALRNRNSELEEENISLRDQITRLQQEDGEYLKHELAQVKHELQVLRNKNHQLMQDNIKLTEHLRRVDTRTIRSSPQRFDGQNQIRNPGYDNRKSDLVLDDPHSGYTSTNVTKLDNDEQFFRDRHRLTQELRQMAAPQKWSERDFRNHGGEAPYIRAANRDPYSRAKSAPPTRRHETYEDIMMVPDDGRSKRYIEEINKERSGTNDHDRCQSNHAESRLRDRRLDELPRQHRDDLDHRTQPSSQDTRLMNNYHAALSQGQHERHLSETSCATVELTRACPLGESQGQGLETMDDFHSSQGLPTSGSSPDTNHLASDLRPPCKHFEPINDVLDNLNKPPTTRCHLKVDLVDDVLNGVKPLSKQASFSNMSSDGLPDMTSGGQGHHMTAMSRDQPQAPGGHTLHNCSSGTQNSTVDDLLDASMDDPGYSRHRRRDSLESCSTDVILRAVDEEMNQLNLEKVQASCEQRGHSANLRSVSPKPILTQHNKGSLAGTVSSRSSYSTKRPFAPRTPADVNIGDVVKFCRHGGKISKGVVKYIGHLPGKNDTYLGLELEHEMAKHDGVYEGVRYFQCKPNRGVFVAFSKVVMAWGE